MGGTQRLAAVAAVAHARHYYNTTTHNETQPYEPLNFNVNVFFASATLCGVVLAVCAACWRRGDAGKRDAGAGAATRVFSVSADLQETFQVESQVATPGPPPAYDAVVYDCEDQSKPVGCTLQSVVSEPCPRCHAGRAPHDAGLPSYEAAVQLRDTKL